MRFVEWQDRRKFMKVIMEEYAGMAIYVMMGMMMAGVFWQLLEKLNGY